MLSPIEVDDLRSRLLWVLVLLAGGIALSWAKPALALDPTTSDCLAASDASLRAGNEHKLRTERAQLLVCAAVSCPADIRKECMRRVEEVNTAIPTIVFEAKDASGNDLAAVTVAMDGELLAERLEGTGLSVDPGEHTFVFRTHGQREVTRRIVVREGQKDRREAVRFGETSSAPTPGALTQRREAPVAAGGALRPRSETTAARAQRTAALASAVIGVLGVGFGSYEGLTAISKKNTAQNLCTDTCTTEAGTSAWHDAHSAGTLSTVGFLIGGVALGAAGVLWLTAPASGSTHVGLGPGGLVVGGTW